jgi:hypothetical protein
MSTGGTMGVGSSDMGSVQPDASGASILFSRHDLDRTDRLFVANLADEEPDVEVAICPPFFEDPDFGSIYASGSLSPVMPWIAGDVSEIWSAVGMQPVSAGGSASGMTYGNAGRSGGASYLAGSSAIGGAGGGAGGLGVTSYSESEAGTPVALQRKAADAAVAVPSPTAAMAGLVLLGGLFVMRRLRNAGSRN